MRLSARQTGILLLVLGAVATIAPLVSSVWGVPIVGIAIFLSGIIELLDAWNSDSGRTHYSSGTFSVLAGALISFQSAFAFSGLMVATSVVLLLDGGTSVVRAVRGAGLPSPGRVGEAAAFWDVINGAGNILLALVVWWLRDTIGVGGFGLFLGLRMAASGWQTLAAPARLDSEPFDEPEDQHPTRALGLPPHPIIGFIHRAAIAEARSRTPTDFYWSVIFVIVFFAIHVGRLDAEWTWLGMLTPASATLGDIVAALVLSIVVLFPLELLWHLVTRPIERAAWHRMLHDATPEMEQRWSERAVRWWAEHRLRRSVARDLENNTLHGALRQLIRAGLPLTAVVIAVHPIWGFSWYFNSENWATAAWQKIAETRVDEWREAMIDAAVQSRGASAVTAPGVFEIRPDGVADGDFSFLVIGDPGEGDTSQHALRDQVLRAAARSAVKFVVIASDVVYPVGAMDWPTRGALDDCAFYPRTDAIAAKLDAETPFWKWPAWWWVRRFGAWPFSAEALSAVFDFNRAPFFQSFVEVRVERSERRVVFAVFGVDGPLRWRDLQTGGGAEFAGLAGDAPVELVVAMAPR